MTPLEIQDLEAAEKHWLEIEPLARTASGEYWDSTQMEESFLAGIAYERARVASLTGAVAKEVRGGFELKDLISSSPLVPSNEMWANHPDGRREIIELDKAKGGGSERSDDFLLP